MRALQCSQHSFEAWTRMLTCPACCHVGPAHAGGCAVCRHPLQQGCNALGLWQILRVSRELKRAKCSCQHRHLQMQQMHWVPSSSLMLLHDSSPSVGSLRGLPRHQQQNQLLVQPLHSRSNSNPRCPSGPVLLLHLQHQYQALPALLQLRHSARSRTMLHQGLQAAPQLHFMHQQLQEACTTGV